MRSAEVPASANDASKRSVLDSQPGSLSERLGFSLGRLKHPALVGVIVILLGYVILAAVTAAIGLLLTNVAPTGWLGRWDESVDAWFVSRRTPTMNSWTNVGSHIATGPLVGVVAAVAVIALALFRRRRQAAFLAAALLLETATFLTVTRVVGRARPAVPRLDPAPPTSSFPSGHTAAALVLWLGLAMIVSTLSTSRAIRVTAWVLGIVVPLGVGLSRIYRGMHHPTDVMGSAVLAAGSLAIAVLAVRATAAAAPAKQEPGATPPPRPATTQRASPRAEPRRHETRVRESRRDGLGRGRRACRKVIGRRSAGPESGARGRRRYRAHLV
jgi:undecaprenyl-diphosphatase